MIRNYAILNNSDIDFNDARVQELNGNGKIVRSGDWDYSISLQDENGYKVAVISVYRMTYGREPKKIVREEFNDLVFANKFEAQRFLFENNILSFISFGERK